MILFSPVENFFLKLWAFVLAYEKSKLGTLTFDVPSLEHIETANRCQNCQIKLRRTEQLNHWNIWPQNLHILWDFMPQKLAFCLVSELSKLQKTNQLFRVMHPVCINIFRGMLQIMSWLALVFHAVSKKRFMCWSNWSLNHEQYNLR